MPSWFVRPEQVVLDAAGGGQVVVGPAGVDWLVKSTSVSTSTRGREPTAMLYLGGVSTARFLEMSYGASGDFSDTVHLMQPGDVLYCVWAGGDPGATAALRVAGVAYPPGEGIEAL